MRQNDLKILQENKIIELWKIKVSLNYEDLTYNYKYCRTRMIVLFIEDKLFSNTIFPS